MKQTKSQITHLLVYMFTISTKVPIKICNNYGENIKTIYNNNITVTFVFYS